MHHTPLLSTIVVGLVLAFAFGAIAHRLKASPLVGYLLAGVVIGPFTPGFVADQTIANELSEIGVILLMFGVGLQFSLEELLSVRAIAVPGALVQIAVATALGAGLRMAARLVARRRASSSASRCRSPAPSWCCAPCRSGACSTPSAAASRSAGWWSRTSQWCWCWCSLPALGRPEPRVCAA